MPSGQSAARPPFGEPLPVQDVAHTKRDLTSWWKQFKKNTPKDDKKVEQPPPTGIFGVPLQTSIRYANVAISLFDSEGHSFIYGYVPIVVAKCGVYLKEKATDVEGIFRLAGAERRIKELQSTFNSPERYGKGLDWTGYTVHDAANILRRYLNQLPEPIIPLNFYERFRDPLRDHQAQAVGELDHQGNDVGGFNNEGAIKTYQQLITELPPLNRQLLLYILDLLAVFASKSDLNKMTAGNLSAIFQPGLLSHPTHDMAPQEYRLSQDVLIFLIENQDHFLVGMQGTAIDQKTKEEVQSGAPSPATPKPRSQQGVGRSTSNASAGADSVRRYGGVRRNVSTSSKHSRQSNNTPSPVTPPASSPFAPSSKTSGVHRSNTVPSKKSPSIGGERFSRDKAPDSPSMAAVHAASAAAALSASGATASVTDVDASGTREATTATVQGGRLQELTTSLDEPRPKSPHLSPSTAEGVRSASQERHASSASGDLKMEMPPSSGNRSGRASPLGTPMRERGFSSFFRSSPTDDKGEPRRPNKLQKRRPDALSPQGSTHSLSGASHPPSPGVPPQIPVQSIPTQLDERESDSSFRTASAALDGQDSEVKDQAVLDRVATETTPATVAETTIHNTEGISNEKGSIEKPTSPEDSAVKTELRDNPQRASGTTTLKAAPSPQGSITSRSTGNEESSHEHESPEQKEKRHHRWRISRSGGKSKNEPTGSHSHLGSVSAAERSNSSVGSAGKPRKSFTDDSNPSNAAPSSSDAEAGLAVGSPPEKKRGPLGWFKGKLEERKEREAEKERAKSPPLAPSAGPVEDSSPPQVSLSAVVTGEGTSLNTEKEAETTAVEPRSEVTATADK